ncbi:MAG: amino acid carrier protein, partial [Bdellovibrionaceae bacterium]|nr:amino acid carrier protein [Pseudobdellovibrionaceae bacterium]
MIHFLAASGLEDFANSLFGSVNSVLSSVFFANVLFFTDGAKLPLAVAWLTVGAVFLTFKMRFANIRYFKHAILLTLGKYDNAKSKGEVSHFKALATALSATVGLGTIAGVTIAISTGGPGATFWIVIAGLIGMSSKFAECTLAQMYRQTGKDGHVLGGPMLYLKAGFAERGWARTGKALAVIFAVLCMFGAYGGGGSFQMNQSMNAIAEIFPFFLEHKWLYGLIMTFLVAIVIIGGLQRIANVTDKIVPLMCGMYVLMGLYVLGINYHAIPNALYLIVSEAFAPNAMYGGFIGVLVVGFRRAAFSNEAGMGSAAIAHSAAKSEYPVQEGIVALLEPFIDTVVVCTMTALMIVITGAYNNPEYIDLIHSNNGAALTARALGSVNSLFPY